MQRRYWLGSRTAATNNLDLESSDVNRAQHEEPPHNAKAGVRVRRLRKVRHRFRNLRSLTLILSLLYFCLIFIMFVGV